MKIFNVFRRSIHSLGEHKALWLERYGDPAEVVKLRTSKPEEILPKSIGQNQVLVQHLAACVNPADVTLIAGRYGLRPVLPAILGNEGVTRVVDVGSGVKHLKPGDTAIGVSTFGYWQSYSVQDAHTFYKVDDSLDVRISCQIKVNPCTSYRMIKDFVELKPRDVIIQNGANSAVGVYVIQLARHWGLKTINVIRERPQPQQEEVVSELKQFGADYVVTESQISSVEFMKPILAEVGKPKLALDCVGGKNSQDCGKILQEDGVMIVYGGMAKQPAQQISTSAMIFKGVYSRGFWMSRWYKHREPERRDEVSFMLDEVCDMFKGGILKPKKTKMISFEERDIAFAGSNNIKHLFSIYNE